MIKALLFDWGDTLMVDFLDQAGPMYSWKKIRKIANVEECLTSLSKKFPCYIATNAKDSSKEDIKKALVMVGIGKYFSDIFCFREIGIEKPLPKFFDFVCSKLNLSRDEIIMVGDDYEKDFAGPREIGIKAILFDPHKKRLDLKPRISDLSKLELQIYHDLLN